MPTYEKQVLGKLTALSYLFIRTWGLDGAAYAGFIAALFALIWAGRVSQRRYRVIYEYRKITLIVVAAVLVYVGITYGPVERLPWIEPIERLLNQGVAGALKDTSLAAWRGGKVLTIVEEKAGDVALLATKTALCLVFGLLAPAAHPGMWARMRSKTRPASRLE